MYYAPHKLQKRVIEAQRNDDLGKPLPAGEYTWADICPCRCDNSDTREIHTDDGHVFYPKYHVVCDGKKPDIDNGDYVRCVRSDDSIKGEGIAVKVKKLNYLPYADFYI